MPEPELLDELPESDDGEDPGELGGGLGGGDGGLPPPPPAAMTIEMNENDKIIARIIAQISLPIDNLPIEYLLSKHLKFPHLKQRKYSNNIKLSHKKLSKVVLENI